MPARHARQALGALTIVCLSCLAPALGQAQDQNPVVAPAPPTISLDGSEIELRSWLASVDVPELDGPQDSPETALFSRLRAAFELNRARLLLRVEADLLTGQLWGDRAASIPAGADQRSVPRQDAWSPELGALLDPRQLYVAYTTPVGQLRAGMQTSNWGLGLIANDGSRENERLFNQSYGGDRAMRLLFATTPLVGVEGLSWGKSFYAALGADVVWSDEFASFRDDDRAYQGVFSLFYRDEDTFGGVYMAYRSQTDRDGDKLDVLAIDAAFKTTRELGSRARLELGVEAALLTGTTSRAEPQDNSASKLDISAIGAAAEASLIHTPSDAAITLLAGYASGEADSQDATLYRFRFDPNYKVGLVLFDHYLPAATRASYRRATDPALSCEPPKGVEGLINDGAVENAMYLNPQLTFGTLDGFMTGVGLLWARAASDPADAYLTLEQGGRPTGVRGASPVSRDLGLEVDLAFQYRRSLISDLILEVKGEFGILFPGEAFDDASGQSAPPIGAARGRVALSW